MNKLPSPAFVVDTAALDRNLRVLEGIQNDAGCKILLALKAFAMFSLFPRMRGRLDGVCASSPNEAQLGREKFGGEVHAYAAALDKEDALRLGLYCDSVSLNSFHQFERLRPVFQDAPREISLGMRVNPLHSEAGTPLYDPCAPFSRLGVRIEQFEGRDLEGIRGLHVHALCENDSFALERLLKAFEDRFEPLIRRMDWINLGGGHHITRDDYDREHLCRLLASFRTRYPNLRDVYLEPGEAVVLNSGVLCATVLDIVNNGADIAILDASCVCHMPDVLEMPYRPRVFRSANWQGAATPPPDADHGAEPEKKPHSYRLAGPSCLAGDIIGDYSFDRPLKIGDRLVFEDMAHYTMVKTNTFNGIDLPCLAVYHPNPPRIEIVRRFGYADFRSRLS